MRKHGFQILLGWLFLATICLLLYFPFSLSHTEKVPSLLIVSFDGFRWDYLTHTPTPHFQDIILKGVHAKKGLHNVFTTSTLTNHWSIVTGLYAESHGIIDNEFFDPVINKTYIPLYKNKNAVNDNRFYDTGAEPIWVTNHLQNHNGRSGSVMWWGAENVIKGVRPTYHMPYDLNVDEKSKIDTIIQWFTSEYPINLGLLYFSEPDHSAHKYGPDSWNVTQKIAEADELTGYLIDQLNKRDLLDDINIIITSDHGFAAVSRDRLIFLDEYVDPKWYHMVHYSPVATIIPHEGKEEMIYQQLLHASKDNHFQVYKKADIPVRLHYKNNRRVTPIVAVADITYSFISNMSADKFVLAGSHGYDNKYTDMRPFFMARGPSFQENFAVDSFSSLDLYPLMCHLLHLEPAPNNGSLAIVKQLLVEPSENSGWTFSTYIVCLILISCVGGLFSVGACRQHRYLRRRLNQLRSVSALAPDKVNILKPEHSTHVPLLFGEEDDDDGELEDDF
ncbi:ectonucleotide pyrophosphatase/phosphodiesterase family member 5 [Aplysia californica]|uniref:Ectonucleotide pyrophosphatase/phosphodiesterase family member 5 n=1 Tax=Aplysia californica TaxID=6500 RepID=A0ABM0K6K0_APLCA|nr:ectonucleotide pyrophosphatase/phosphodiesterase family member 5 [Aplysia californica]